MKTRTRTIIALLLISLGFSPLLITIAFHLKREVIRDRMKEKLETSTQLETVILPADEVIWMDDHEIWVNEQMFDIHSKEFTDGIYTFKGHFDKEETKLVIAKRASGKRHHDEKKLLTRFFQLLPAALDDTRIEYFTPVALKPNFDVKQTFSLTNHFSKVPTPPPELTHFI